MTEVLLALGSSLGDREKILRLVILKLKADPQVRLLACSSVWGSIPIGVAQNIFRNMVIRIETSYSALELLKELQHIEHEFGRVRGVHWSDRSIDIDILLFGDQLHQLSHLEIPHPRMLERGFVILPCLEIAADMVYPNTGVTLGEIEYPEFLGQWKIGLLDLPKSFG